MHGQGGRYFVVKSDKGRIVTRVLGKIVLLEVEPDATCELCGEVAELRPYGPKGENICFACGELDRETTDARMRERLFGRH